MKSLSRRKFLHLSAASAGTALLAAAGCAPGAQPDAPVTPAPVSPTAQLTTAPTATVGAPTATATSQATAAAVLPSATATPLPSPTPDAAKALTGDVTRQAVRFLETLDDNRRKKATYAFDDQERFRWHWTTPGGFPRHGLPLREMSAAQKAEALALLRASVSEAGYRKALDIMSLQRDLGNDPDEYYVTVFGTPGAPRPWGWRFEGHHLSRHTTVVDGQLAQTPLFHGSWPTRTDAGLRAMPREEDAALELINALQGKNRQTAIFQASTLTNHVTQNDPKVSPLASVGIRFGDLDDRQQQLALEIVQSYLGAMRATVAVPAFERVKAGLGDVRFGWAGSLEKRRPQYYRLQGSTFILEFDNSRNGGTHVHSVWRDFEQDFGYNLL